MKLLNLILVLSFSVIGLTTGFIWSNRGLQGMSVTVSAKDLQNEGLRLVTPSDKSFKNLLAESGESPVVEDLKPYSVILKNTGKQTVVSFMLKWDLVRPDGIVLSRHFEYITAWALEGQGIDKQGGYIVRPGSDWLLAPGLAIELTNLNNANMTQGPPAHLTRRIAKDMAEFTNITVTLDGVFFDDGTFVGPNNTQFFEKVVAFQKARRDVLEELAMKTKDTRSQEDIFREVESLVKQPKVRLGKKSTIADYYNSFKADFAADLMKMKNVSGSQKTLEQYLPSLDRKWATLKKRN